MKKIDLVKDMDTVAGRLYYARSVRGMTQIDLNGKSGIKAQYISDIECKRRLGGPRALAALADALDVTRGWLMFGAGMRPK